jgi:site-specific recombinase XerD
MLTPGNERLYREWQRARKSEGHAELPRNRRALERLEAHAGGADLDTLTTGDIRDWVGSLDTLATSSRLSYFSTARAFYNFLAADQIIPASPMAGMHEPKNPLRPVPIPPDDAIGRLLAAAGTDRSPMGLRDAAMIRVLLDTGGPRATELATMLRMGAAPPPRHTLGADLDADTITVCGKGGKIRTWPVAARTGRALARWDRARARMRDAASPQLWLQFRAKAGAGLTRSGVQDILARRCEAAGITRLHPHQMRHFSYHHFLLAGGSVNDAKILYGWEDDTMPQRYAAALADERALRTGHTLAIGDQW